MVATAGGATAPPPPLAVNNYHHTLRRRHAATPPLSDIPRAASEQWQCDRQLPHDVYLRMPQTVCGAGVEAAAMAMPAMAAAATGTMVTTRRRGRRELSCMGIEGAGSPAGGRFSRTR